MSEEKIYPLSLSPSNCAHWSVGDALREVIQGAIDEGEADINYNADNEMLTITNFNTQIPKQFLLMGASNKRDDKDKRGTFGDGMCNAWLILTRYGHNVEIKNGDVLWTPYYDHSELFGCDMLHVSETPLEDNDDVEYTISNITQEQYDEMCSRCLFLVDDCEVVAETRYGNILENKDNQGKLFVGALYVCDTDMDYTYDIKPEFLQLDRDRNTPPNFDLKWVVKNMWASASSKEETVSSKAADLLFNGASDAYIFNETCPENSLVQAAYDKAVEEYGDNFALADDDSDKEEQHNQGYKNIKVTGKSDFNALVRKHQEYKDNLVQEKEYLEEFSPVEVIEELLKKYGYLDDNFHSDLEEVIDVFLDKGVEWGYSYTLTEKEFPFSREEE